MVLKLHSLGLPIDDNYLYEFSGIPKPDNYEVMIAKREEQKEAMSTALEGGGTEETPTEQPTNTSRTPLGQRLRHFFGLAPWAGGQSDF